VFKNILNCSKVLVPFEKLSIIALISLRIFKLVNSIRKSFPSTLNQYSVLIRFGTALKLITLIVELISISPSLIKLHAKAGMVKECFYS